MLQGKTILVAEDVEINQHLTKYILESYGAKAVIANNGTEALRLASSQYFDCILMDVQMPEMDGVQATREIRALSDSGSAAVSIIALTANVHAEDLQRYRNAGMDDYLAKPFDESKLLAAILKNQSGTRADKSSAVPRAPAPADSPARLYDLTLISSISGGDSGFLRKMILLFNETVPQNVKELVEAMENSNWEQVFKMAHKLKSTVDSMGIKSIREDIRTVEANARNLENLQAIPSLVARVDEVIRACVIQLQQEIA